MLEAPVSSFSCEAVGEKFPELLAKTLAPHEQELMLQHVRQCVPCAIAHARVLSQQISQRLDNSDLVSED